MGLRHWRRRCRRRILGLLIDRRPVAGGTMKKLLFILLLLCLSSNAFAQNKGVLLENLTWQEAEKALKPETVVVIPLGAAAKEHGPHLKLKNDWAMAEYYKRRVLKAADVVIAP